MRHLLKADGGVLVEIEPLQRTDDRGVVSAGLVALKTGDKDAERSWVRLPSGGEVAVEPLRMPSMAVLICSAKTAARTPVMITPPPVSLPQPLRRPRWPKRAMAAKADLMESCKRCCERSR
jgi:hypothetical protein